jgi:perosamine synthetase
MYQKTIEFIRELYSSSEFIPLHAPLFCGNEKEYLNKCIDTSYVSSVGEFVDRFEREIAEICGTLYGVAIVNGTSALQIALKIAGVQPDHEVITQALTFVATPNAISHCGAHPIFLDVDRNSLSLGPEHLHAFLSEKTKREDGRVINTETGRIIKAVVPVHIFGHIGQIERLQQICTAFGLTLIEDAAESIGSLKNGKPAASFGQMGILSFNGNKIVTSGGGGALVTNDKNIAARAKHLTTTAKIPHRWEYVHDEVGFNFRMPNTNAALLCAQLENLQYFLRDKREIASSYQGFFSELSHIEFLSEPEGSHSNYWLNAILLPNSVERDRFLQETNDQGVMTRPAWRLMNQLAMYAHCQTSDLSISQDLRRHHASAQGLSNDCQSNPCRIPLLTPQDILRYSPSAPGQRR